MNIAITEKRKARVQYDDLREWIMEADKLGELVRANGYSWQEDIGMAAELLQHDAGAPVALFDEIPGYPKGFRVLTNFFGGRRQNMTLGFSPDLNKTELSEAFLADFQKISDTPLPYQVVETGPVMENVIEGDAVDVTRFPTPVWHDRDEGRRYIGTGSFNVTRDPEDGWVNAGTYRVMIHDGKRLGFYISPGKHGRIHRDKYAALNAVILGVSMQNEKSHQEFCAKESLTFKLLADTKKEASEKYDSVMNFGVMQLSARHTFLIDPNGLVRKVWTDVDVKRHSDDVLGTIEEMQKAK